MGQDHEVFIEIRYCSVYCLIELDERDTTRPAKSTGLPSRLLLFLTPSTGLLGDRTFLLVLKKKSFFVFTFVFLWIHCLVIDSLQPATKYMLFDN